MTKTERKKIENNEIIKRLDKLISMAKPGIPGTTETSFFPTPTGNKSASKLFILTVSSKGYGKRTPLIEYPRTLRGGKGVITYHPTSYAGDIVAVKVVSEDIDVMVITAKGKAIRFKVNSLCPMGRATCGVRLIRLDPLDEVVALVRRKFRVNNAKVNVRRSKKSKKRKQRGRKNDKED